MADYCEQSKPRESRPSSLDSSQPVSILFPNRLNRLRSISEKKAWKVPVLVLALFVLLPALVAWYLTSEWFDEAEYTTSSVTSSANFNHTTLNYFQPRAEQISLCGDVTLSESGRPAAGVSLALNGKVAATSDGAGYFEFIGANLVQPAGVPPGAGICRRWHIFPRAKRGEAVAWSIGEG